MFRITKSNIADYIGMNIQKVAKSETLDIGTGIVKIKNPVIRIPFTEVTNFKEISEEFQDNSNKKDVGKTIGRVAGIPFGVAGVLAGGALGSTKKKNTIKGSYAMEFNKKDWIIFQVDLGDGIEGTTNRLLIEDYFKTFADIQDSPFD
tara:strand:+ start:29 stop:472 length:444 start_codon:yes stop_codon:yes gene_type:complete